MCEHWCLSQRTLVHKDMSSQTCTKLLKQGVSLWCGLEKDTDRICPSSPRQTWSSNLNHTASQLQYFRLQVNGQIRGICCEWRAKDLEVRLKLAKNLKPLLELPQQLCYLCIDSSHCLIPWHVHSFRQRKWAVSSPESCISHKDNFNLNASMVS